MKPLELGWHDVALECPDCHALVVVAVELLTVRQSSTDEPITLRLKAKTDKTVHACGEPRLPFDDVIDVGEAHARRDPQALP